MLTNYCGGLIFERSNSMDFGDCTRISEICKSSKTPAGDELCQQRRRSQMCGDQDKLVRSSLDNVVFCYTREHNIEYGRGKASECTTTPVKRANPRPPQGQLEFWWAPRRKCGSRALYAMRASNSLHLFPEVRRKLVFDDL
uniref:Uncharacterized protein n=1 Tax=Parascaris univalens TaxID=6257 RepID=A0A915BN18_PARUN